MAQLDDYLARKEAVLAARRSDFQADADKALVRLKAQSWVAGNTGARPVRMGEIVWVTDSAPALAGHALGPTAPEMLLGALASCLVHTYLIEATLMNLPLDSVEVTAQGALNMSAVVGLPASEAPRLEQVRYSAQVTSAAEADQIEELHRRVEAGCPVLNTLRFPVAVQRQPA